MTKWYLKIFKRLLNTTVLISFVVYRQVTGRNIQQLSYIIRLVEGLFTKYACAEETLSVQGRQASDNTFPRLTERHFLRKVAPKTEKLKPQRRCVLKVRKKENFTMYCCQICDVMAFAWKTALSCIARSSLTEVMTIILLHLYSFKISLLTF